MSTRESKEDVLAAWWRAMVHFEAVAKEQGGGLTEEQHAEYQAVKKAALDAPYD